jgi:hypothetical protein
MRGAIHVAFEEGTQAQWLHELLAPREARRHAAVGIWTALLGAHAPHGNVRTSSP